MILARAGYLSLFGLGILVPLIYFLRARNLRHRVSAVFLWETLQSGHRTRLARFRFRLDWVLLAQMVALALLVVATAGPALRVRQPTLSTMAIVIDGSASMRGTTAEGRPKAEEAIAQALEVLGSYPGTPVTIIQLSMTSKVLAPLDGDHDAARSAIARFEPTWTGDGTTASLATLLESQQATDRYERIFLISDHDVAELPASFSVQFIPITTAGNLSIDAFNVRRQPNGRGVVVFAGVRNDDSQYRETELRVSDGSSRVRLPLVLAPGERQSFVLPFPAARGVAYTAELTPGDEAPFDDLRYYVLPQTMPRVAAWIGPDDPFLRAAVEVSGPILWTEELGEAEFIVVNGAAALREPETAPEPLPKGNLFLVSMMARRASESSVGQAAAFAPMQAVAVGSAILDGISPDVLRVDVASLANEDTTRTLPGDGLPLLIADEQEVLVSGVTEEGRWVALIPDLWSTNLPLSVDFPLLVDNVLAYLSPQASSIVWAQMEPGQAVDLGWTSPEAQVVDPSGALQRSMPAESGLPRDDTAETSAGGVLVAEIPGFYEIVTSSGSILLASNVSADESGSGTVVEASGVGLPVRTETGLFALWPWFALVACMVLLIEAAVYHGAWSPRSRR